MAKCRPGPTIKSVVLTSSNIYLWQIKMKEHYVSCYAKIKRNILKIRTEMGLFFHSRLWVLLYMLVRHLPHYNPRYFSAFFPYASMDQE